MGENSHIGGKRQKFPIPPTRPTFQPYIGFF